MKKHVVTLFSFSAKTSLEKSGSSLEIAIGAISGVLFTGMVIFAILYHKRGIRSRNSQYRFGADMRYVHKNSCQHQQKYLANGTSTEMCLSGRFCFALLCLFLLSSCLVSFSALKGPGKTLHPIQTGDPPPPPRTHAHTHSLGRTAEKPNLVTFPKILFGSFWTALFRRG